jgi:hypothetical protein
MLFPNKDEMSNLGYYINMRFMNYAGKLLLARIVEI